MVLVGSLSVNNSMREATISLKLANVRRVDDDRDDVVQSASGRFKNGLHVANALARLLGHVAGTH